jgi:hypothetical protein
VHDCLQEETLTPRGALRARDQRRLGDYGRITFGGTEGVLTLRGQAAQSGDWLDWLETTSRETAATEITVAGLGSAAAARAALEQHDAAATLLTEVDSAPDGRATDY